MKMPWFLPLAAVVFLAGCTPDRTLETLIPGDSLAVVLVEHPGLTSALLGSRTGDLPWASLDGDRPWAAAVVPADPPGFLLALALARQPQAWADVQAWARDRGGLTAARVGSYAVLTSPGLAPASALAEGRYYDLSRVRAGGDWVAVYLDVGTLLGRTAMAGSLGLGGAFVPLVRENLAGLRLGFSGKNGGAEVRLSTDWMPGSAWARELRPDGVRADLSPWTGLLPRGDGFGAVMSLAPRDLAALGTFWGSRSLTDRWTALVPVLGPRAALAALPRADGTWAWSAAVETSDPQAVRQALKTLVASGDVQKKYADWALDADTPLIYRDRPDGFGGVLASLDLGGTRVQLGYGKDRIAVAGGFGAEDAVRLWRQPAGSAAPWAGEVGAGATAAATGSLDGLGGRASLSALSDGNWELRLWVDAPGLRAWEERLPQVVRSFLAGQGGWTSLEP